MKVLAGVVCLLAGIALSTVAFAYNNDFNDRKLWDWEGFAVCSGVAVLSFAIFSTTRFFFVGRMPGFFLGFAGSCVGLCLPLYVFGGAEGRMWFPIILLFGIPLMSPLLLLTGLGCWLVWGAWICRSTNP